MKQLLLAAGLILAACPPQSFSAETESKPAAARARFNARRAGTPSGGELLGGAASPSLDVVG